MTALRQHLANLRASMARTEAELPPPLNHEEVMQRVDAGVALLKWIAAVFAAVALAAAWRM